MKVDQGIWVYSFSVTSDGNIEDQIGTIFYQVGLTVPGIYGNNFVLRYATGDVWVADNTDTNNKIWYNITEHASLRITKIQIDGAVSQQIPSSTKGTVSQQQAACYIKLNDSSVNLLGIRFNNFKDSDPSLIQLSIPKGSFPFVPSVARPAIINASITISLQLSV